MDIPQNPVDQQEAAFQTHRVLPCTPQQVFAAFARPELLARWWGPSGFTNSFEIFEFKSGGRWKFVMHGPNGSNHPNESVFLKLDPPSTLVIQHLSPPHFILTISLAAHPGGTEISWAQVFESSAVAAAIGHIVEPANEQNLDRLQAVLLEETQGPNQYAVPAHA
ncbi:MAG TPA: SRPBCC family protein [Prosthecobacter sp.]|nr:SRPBCC family protein [Prosthecobacter sp.]